MRISAPRVKSVKRKDNKHGRTYTIVLTDPDETIVRPSVTTRLNAIHSEPLVGWRIRREASIHKEAALRLAALGLDGLGFGMAYDGMVKEIRARLDTDSPAKIGDNVHAMIEAWSTSQPLPVADTEDAMIAFNKFEHWAKVNEYEPWGAELPLWNGVAAGTMDGIGTVKATADRLAGLYTLDYKTGSIHPEYDLQIGKYSAMVLEMFKRGLLVLEPGSPLQPLMGGIILKLPKTTVADPVERVRTRVEMELDARRFNAVTEIDEWVRTHGTGPLEVAVY